MAGRLLGRLRFPGRSPVLKLYNGLAENLGRVLKFIHWVAMGRKREEQSRSMPRRPIRIPK
jgi:hypothetical protein